MLRASLFRVRAEPYLGQMRCGVLGPLEIRGENGALLDVPGAKERLLLALLAAEAPDVVSVDRLHELLWNGDPPPSARKSLQVHVARLRSALEPDRPRGSPGQYVVRRPRGYALVVGADLTQAEWDRYLPDRPYEPVCDDLIGEE